MKKSVFFTFLILAICMNSSLFSSGVEITISKKIDRKIRLTILPTSPALNASIRSLEFEKVFNELLLFDLSHAGYFEIWPDKAVFPNPDNTPVTPYEISYDYWLNKGTELVLTCMYSLNGNSGSIELFCYDIALRKQLVKISIPFYGNNDRFLFHQLTAAFIEHFSGAIPSIALSQISYVEQTGAAKNILCSDYDGYNRKQITFGDSLNLNPEWASHTQGLFFVSYKRDYPFIFFQDFNANTLAVVSHQPGLNAFPVPSPDGTMIAATLSVSGNPEIYILGTSGEIIRRITYHESVDSSPCWSPDSTQLAFVSDRSGTPQIYTISLYDETPKRITYHGNYNASPDWNPTHGSTILIYTSLYGKNSELCMVDVSSGNTKRLTATLASEEDPSWAPDGIHISYTLTQDYRSDIYFMDVRDQQPFRLTTGNGSYSSSSWQKYPIYHKKPNIKE
ncbi:PD40 domain-containing protein [bacterium]|nr:PD40 domain-containing protein [bacterium]MCP5462478.1 PD40 domain-containing protein [bacterium]